MRIPRHYPQTPALYAFFTRLKIKSADRQKLPETKQFCGI
ncbi:hypothetical protein [Methylomonas fluvii]|nr:hypothetical protein [Methylomonas fluvii]